MIQIRTLMITNENRNKNRRIVLTISIWPLNFVVEASHNTCKMPSHRRGSLAAFSKPGQVLRFVSLIRQEEQVWWNQGIKNWSIILQNEHMGRAGAHDFEWRRPHAGHQVWSGRCLGFLFSASFELMKPWRWLGTVPESRLDHSGLPLLIGTQSVQWQRLGSCPFNESIQNVRSFHEVSKLHNTSNYSE